MTNVRDGFAGSDFGKLLDLFTDDPDSTLIRSIQFQHSLLIQCWPEKGLRKLT